MKKKLKRTTLFVRNAVDCIHFKIKDIHVAFTATNTYYIILKFVSKTESIICRRKIKRPNLFMY